MSKQYEVWHWYQFESGRMATTRYAVNNPFEAARVIWQRSMIDLRNELIVANAFGLEEWDEGQPGLHDGEWTEWYSPFGEDIDEFSDSLNIREAM